MMVYCLIVGIWLNLLCCVNLHRFPPALQDYMIVLEDLIAFCIYSLDRIWEILETRSFRFIMIRKKCFFQS